MSEMTTAILIYRQSIDDLQHWVRKKKKQAYIVQITKDWTGLLIENDLRVGEKWAGTAAKELEKPVMFLGNYDEFGWKADFWEHGERLIHIDLPYEQPRKAKVDLSGAERWRAYASNPELLERLHALLSSSARLDAEGVNLLKQAFGLENLTFLSYDYVYTYSEDTLEEKGIIEVKAGKALKLKQVIMEEVGMELEKRGYWLHPESGGRNMPQQYIFSKFIGSYRYQIRIENWQKNKLELTYFPPDNRHSIMIFMREHYQVEFSYSNELELRRGLERMLNIDLNRGILWLETQEVEEFDLAAAYQRILDPIMEKAGFQRKKNDKGQTGEYINFIYGTPDGKWRILFSHYYGLLAAGISMRRFNETMDQVLHYPEKNAKPFENRFHYKNQAELGSQLAGAAQAFFELLAREEHLKYDPELRGFDF